MHRRTFLAACAVSLLAIAMPGMGAYASETRRLDAKTAHERAQAGEILLIDIRRPQEWRETGVGTSATPITMHDPKFLENLEAAVSGDKTRPVAFICATGVRSAYVAGALGRYGYTEIYDVSEGMLGSRRSGPGWIALELPVRQP